MAEINLDANGIYIGRIWRPDIGPCLVMVSGGEVYDITGDAVATCSQLLEMPQLDRYLKNVDGKCLCKIDELSSDLASPANESDTQHLLAPCDLQAIKAAGVTFARSTIERVIEERADGDLTKAAEIRAEVLAALGGSLQDLVPGSRQADDLKRLLIDKGLWSQYLEVGIGPYAEVFTKAQPMSAVGWGAKIGLHPESTWNNPEPEIVLAVASNGEIKGASLGNDVNLRDFEGRSALLLGKAKDNNASASIGPFIRIFDDTFQLDDIKEAVIGLSVSGEDGFVLEDQCSMNEISRPPETIVEQTIGAHHQYPDGFMLYLGSMFAPVKDRDAEGQGFTHKVGDTVTIETPALGVLTNTVDLSTNCPPWTFGTAALMANLADRGLL